MRKKYYNIAVAILAVLLIIPLGMILRRFINEFGSDSSYKDVHRSNNINSKTYSYIMDEFGISPFKGLKLKRISLSGGRDRTLFSKMSINKSLLDKFKKSLRFKSVELKSFHPLVIMGDFTTISSSDIDCIYENIKSGIRIVYTKEKNGIIVIFISKSRNISSHTYSLFYKK